MSGRAKLAGRQRRAYAALAKRLRRLKQPDLVRRFLRRDVRRYVRYVDAAVGVTGLIVETAADQRQRQVSRLVGELRVNARRRHAIADRLKLPAC
jgi:hypothetical protein